MDGVPLAVAMPTVAVARKHDGMYDANRVQKNPNVVTGLPLRHQVTGKLQTKTQRNDKCFPKHVVLLRNSFNSSLC